jgi:uncharacterized protein with HEPN domain
MSKKDDSILLGHMLETAEKIQGKIAGKSRQEFDDDENLRLALSYLLQIIGEAANHISPAFLKAHPEIPWKQIIGMRHKVVHDYIKIDQDVIWQTSTEEIKPLIKMLKPLLKD